MTTKPNPSYALLNEAIGDWHRQWSDHTVECYASSLRRLVVWLWEQDHTTLLSATKHDLNGYLTAREDGAPGVRKVSLATVHGDYKAIRAFYTWAVAEEVLDNNPALRIKVKPVPVPIMPIASSDDFDRLMKACDADKRRWLGVRNAAALELMFGHGLRRGEVVYLDVEDVDTDGDWLIVRDPKNNESRRIALTDDGHKRLRKWLRQRGEIDSPALFLGRDGNRLTGSGLFQAINAYATALGIKDIGPHTFRRGNTKDAKKRNISEATIMVNNGWKDYRMIHRYTKAASMELAADEIRTKRNSTRRLRAV